MKPDWPISGYAVVMTPCGDHKYVLEVKTSKMPPEVEEEFQAYLNDQINRQIARCMESIDG